MTLIRPKACQHEMFNNPAGYQRLAVAETIAACAKRRTAIDVGAHIGTWSLQLAPYFSRVFALEPMPANYECLVENTRNEKNITAMHMAAGEVMGRGKPVYENELNSGAAYFVPTPDGPVPMVTIDHLDLAEVDLIKVDVQGAELEVLHGAIETLITQRPVLCVEMFLDGHYNPNILVFLREIGYRKSRPIGTLGRDWLWQ